MSLEWFELYRKHQNTKTPKHSKSQKKLYICGGKIIVQTMAKDLYHEQFRSALTKDGWTITHDPYEIRSGRIGYEIDFGAEKLLAAY
jgi:XisH protein